MKSHDLSYIAGYFDGEGCIFISTRTTSYKEQIYKSYYLACKVGSTNLMSLKFIESIFGGSTAVHKWRLEHYPNRRKFWAWTVYSEQAINFLKAIYPYLILKKAEAELAFKFQNSKTSHQTQTEEQKAIWEAERILMQNLKKAQI